MTARAAETPARGTPVAKTAASTTGPGRGAEPESSPPNPERTGDGTATGPRALLARLNTPAVRTRLGTLAGVVILAVLLWRLGTGVFVDGLRRIDGPSCWRHSGSGW